MPCHPAGTSSSTRAAPISEEYVVSVGVAAEVRGKASEQLSRTGPLLTVHTNILGRQPLAVCDILCVLCRCTAAARHSTSNAKAHLTGLPLHGIPAHAIDAGSGTLQQLPSAGVAALVLQEPVPSKGLEGKLPRNEKLQLLPAAGWYRFIKGKSIQLCAINADCNLPSLIT